MEIDFRFIYIYIYILLRAGFIPRVKILRIPSFRKLDRVPQERFYVCVDLQHSRLSGNNSLIYVLRDALSLDSGE